MSLTESIKARAAELGFDLVGVTTADPITVDEQAYLDAWLQGGCPAGMQWMHRNLARRVAPAGLLAGARSVICTATAYGRLPAETLPIPERLLGRIADYARLDDYHVFLKERLFALADAISHLVDGGRPRFKVCVDSAPLAERSLARRAGLGFIGKNHMLTSAHLGSQLLLGEIVTDLALDPDVPVQMSCGDCTQCIQACPSGALRPDGGFDSARCISYLTIEHKGPIENELASSIGNRLFGCDECVLACPYTQGAASRALNVPPAKRPRHLLLNEIVSWDKVQFEACFKCSPVERLGLEGLKRNAEICLANAGGELRHGATKMS